MRLGGLISLENTRVGYSPVARPPPPLNKKKYIVNTMISKVLRNSQFSPNQPLKSADDLYIGIVKNNKSLRNYF